MALAAGSRNWLRKGAVGGAGGVGEGGWEWGVQANFDQELFSQRTFERAARSLLVEQQ